MTDNRKLVLFLHIILYAYLVDTEQAEKKNNKNNNTKTHARCRRNTNNISNIVKFTFWNFSEHKYIREWDGAICKLKPTTIHIIIYI